jgi:hypothetical protein
METAFRLTFLALSAILALAAFFALASWTPLSILLAIGLAAFTVLLIALLYRRPPGPAPTTVPAP